MINVFEECSEVDHDEFENALNGIWCILKCSGLDLGVSESATNANHNAGTHFKPRFEMGTFAYLVI